MSDVSEKLPGEVWRGLDEDGIAVAVAICEGVPKAYRWVYAAADWYGAAGAEEVLTAWALALRTAVTTALASLNSIGRDGETYSDNPEDHINDARAALRALGVDP